MAFAVSILAFALLFVFIIFGAAGIAGVFLMTSGFRNKGAVSNISMVIGILLTVIGFPISVLSAFMSGYMIYVLVEMFRGNVFW
ncbi:MAG: hypothetical protein IKZ76_04370 [Lachnospiraceae bacterium]|nr:hypothetical protein [Lachnospiraceae bacterium]MBR5917300.1 hypothetical protein [Lachnospiraceae bacterium]